MSQDAERYERITELFSEYSRGRISRRQFVRGAVAIGGVAAVQALLVACGSSSSGSPSTKSASTSTSASSGSATGTTSAASTTGASTSSVANASGNAPSTPGAAMFKTTTPTLAPQKLVYAGGQDAPTIDPSDRTDYSINALSIQLYDRLFRNEGGWPQPIDPCLCTSYEASKDAREWTFHLTDKAKFHDGSPVTAEAVQYSFNRTLQLKLPRADALLPIMNEKSITIPDQYTVKMTLTQPYSSLPRVLTQPIMNPKVVKDHAGNGDMGQAWLKEHEAGSGPFTIKNWTVGTSYELEWYPEYWQGYPGDSHLSGFVWQIVREGTSQRIGLTSKQFDIGDNINEDDVSALSAQPYLNVPVNYGTGEFYTKLNNQKEPTNDPNFRMFMAYAFDYQGFIKAVNGMGKILDGVIPSGIPYFDPAVGGYTTDLNKAKEYLNKTKWANGGLTLDYVYVTGLSNEEQCGLIWLAQLKKFNIKVNLIPKVWPQMVSACTAPGTAPNMSMIQTGYTVPDFWYFYQYYSPNWNRPTGGDYNTCSFFKDPSFDKMVVQVRSTTDEAEKKKIYGELQEILHQQAPDIPIYLSPNILGMQNRVQGYKYYGAISVDFWRLWIDESKELVKPTS